MFVTLRRSLLRKLGIGLVKESPGPLILRKLSELPSNARDSFYSLSYITPPSVSRDATLSAEQIALFTFQTNAISAGQNVGIFPRVARLNHGCSAAFNAVYSWREKDGELVVHALKPIARGKVGL